jgi:hypothetical protein
MVTILRVDTLTCGCRCSCHPGLCARPIRTDPDKGLDCDAGCRGMTSILDAACDLDQMARPISHMAMTPSSRRADVIDRGAADEWPDALVAE